MSILNVGSEYPPGYIGNPYNALDIGVFFDLNWPDHAGVKAQGFPSYSSGIGLGQAGCATAVCDQFADDGSCIEYDDSSCVSSPALPTPPPGSTLTAAQLQAGMTNCAASGGIFNSITGNCLAADTPNVPLNTPVTPAQAGLTAAQQAALITATGNSAVSLIRTAEGGPYTVAGTNLVYNPATGALTTSTAVNATASLTAGLSAITPYIPLILAAIAAVVILPGLMGKK